MIPRFPPKVKPLILLFILDAFSTLWWLVTFALLADNAAKIGLYVDPVYTGNYYNNYKTALDLTRACAALGAGEL